MLQAATDIIAELQLLSFEKSKKIKQKKWGYVPKDRRPANTLIFTQGKRAEHGGCRTEG